LSILTTIIGGWKNIIRQNKANLEDRLKFFGIRKVQRVGRDYQDICCASIPSVIRARPDPYVYSQDWLNSRSIAIVWDNPDFKIIDSVTGVLVNRFDIRPNTKYDVEVTVHNNSTMAALDTIVRFEVHSFGIDTEVKEELARDKVDIAPFGTAIARTEWQTPGTSGHNCIRALIHHIDDANPLNNIGQHNTIIALPASLTRKTTFKLRNSNSIQKIVRLETDAYRLPEIPLRPQNFEERDSLNYLHKIQTENSRTRYPVPHYLNPILTIMKAYENRLEKTVITDSVIELQPRQEIEVTLQISSPPSGTGTHSVNVNAYHETYLIGGITAYVEEKGG
jgi:hypothetical protein